MVIEATYRRSAVSPPSLECRLEMDPIRSRQDPGAIALATCRFIRVQYRARTATAGLEKKAQIQLPAAESVVLGSCKTHVIPGKYKGAFLESVSVATDPGFFK